VKIPIGLSICASSNPKDGLSGFGRSVAVFEGTLRLVFADGVEMGRLDFKDGKCIGVSLPASDQNALRESGPRKVRIEGILFAAPTDVEVAEIRVNERTIGFRQCENQYIFVSDRRNISWK
jgi:hypothetical protein